MNSLQRLVQIRALLWSLLNQHHVVNLWTMCSRLNDEPARLAVDVLSAALMGKLTDTQVKQTLIECGEMERYDRENHSNALDDAKSSLVRILRSTPPSDGHCKLARALRTLNDE